MIIIIRALSQWGKDDGDYDTPISRDETPDEKIKKKQAKEAQKKSHKKRENAQIKKWEKKREGTMLLSFFHTCASK